MNKAAGALVIALGLLPPLPARAQTDDARARARALHEQGVAAFESEAYDDAIVAFREAYELAPAPGILFNLAQAHAAKGPRSCPEARRAYSMYLQSSPAAHHRALVQARIDELEACSNAEEKRRAAEAEPIAPARKAEAVAPPRARPATPKQRPKPKPEPTSVSERGEVPWLAVGAVGAGVISAAIGTVLYVSAGSDYDDLKSRCGDRCAPSSWQEAADRERTGLVLIGIGGAVAIGSLVVWLATGGSGEAPASARVTSPGGVVAAW